MEPIECFGYTVNTLLHSHDAEKLVKLPIFNTSGEEIWVDRFDAQLLLDDPSKLWEKGPTVPSYAVPLEVTDLQATLNAERYRDLAVRQAESSATNIEDNAKDGTTCVLPGPTSSLRGHHHIGEPTAAELSGRPSTNDSGECYNVSNTYGSKKKREFSLETQGNQQQKREIFRIDLNSVKTGREYIYSFMQEVKSRHASTGLPMSSFWPENLYEHLCIERTASLLNTLGQQSDIELKEFVQTLRDEDRLCLGFIHQWHSLNPYFRMIKGLKYCHADHTQLPEPIMQIFTTPQAPLKIINQQQKLPLVSKAHSTQNPSNSNDSSLDLLADYSDDSDHTTSTSTNIETPLHVTKKDEHKIKTFLNSSMKRVVEPNYSSSRLTQTTTTASLSSKSLHHESSLLHSNALSSGIIYIEEGTTKSGSLQDTTNDEHSSFHIPNLCWDNIETISGITKEGGRIIQEIGYELFRGHDKEMIKTALSILKTPTKSVWKFLDLQTCEWDYLRNILIRIFLNTDYDEESIPLLQNRLHTTTVTALQILKNAHDLKHEQK